MQLVEIDLDVLAIMFLFWLGVGWTMGAGQWERKEKRRFRRMIRK